MLVQGCAAYYAVATRLGLSIHPPGGRLELFTAAVTLDGAIDGQRVRVRRTIGKMPTLKIAADLSPPLDLGLHLTPQTVTQRMRRHLRGAEYVEVGFQEIDEAFAIRADESERARALLGAAELREALLSHEGHGLTVTDAEVELDLDLAVGNGEAELERFMRAAAALARGFDAARRSPAPARVLAPSVDAWRAFAAERGLSVCLGAPMWLYGDLAGVRAWVSTRRKERDVHEVEVTVHLDQPLDFALDITPARGGIFGWFAGQDIQLGEPAFDAAFTVKTDAPERARAVLDRGLQSALLAMSRGRQLVLSSRAVAVRDDAADFSPGDVPALVEALADAARQMSRNARLPPQQGYR
jgi:hypothetical protein